MESIFTKHYKYFLSDDEIQQLLDGKDFWLTASDFESRFKQRNELLMKEMQEEQEIDNSSHGIAFPLCMEERRITEHIAFLKKLIEERK